MKAQFVYESLNFERGRDPKAALNIGILDKYGFLPKEKELILDLWKAVEMDKKRERAIDAIDQFGRAGQCYLRIFSSMKGGLRYFKDLFKKSGFDKYLDPEMKAHMDVLSWKGKPCKEAYFDINPEYDEILKNISTIGEKFKEEYSRNHLFLYPLYSLTNESIAFVYEALDFERGRDPLKTMGIGNLIAQSKSELRKNLEKLVDELGGRYKIVTDPLYKDDSYTVINGKYWYENTDKVFRGIKAILYIINFLEDEREISWSVQPARRYHAIPGEPGTDLYTRVESPEEAIDKIKEWIANDIG